MQLAHDLGIPCLTSAEAFPSSDLIVNPGFEAGLAGWVRQVTGNDIVESSTQTADTGLTGTKVARLSKVDTNTTAIAVKQQVPVTPGCSYVLSGRVKVATGPTNTNTGAWAARLKLEYASAHDLTAWTTGVSTVSPDVPTYGTWQRVATSAWTCPAGVRAVLIHCVVQIGTTDQAPLPDVYFDHVALAEVAHGDHG